MGADNVVITLLICGLIALGLMRLWPKLTYKAGGPASTRRGVPDPVRRAGIAVAKQAARPVRYAGRRTRSTGIGWWARAVLAAYDKADAADEAGDPVTARRWRIAGDVLLGEAPLRCHVKGCGWLSANPKLYEVVDHLREHRKQEQGEATAPQLEEPAAASTYDGEAEVIRQGFQYELCHECGKDVDEHDIVPDPLGHATARCRPDAGDRHTDEATDRVKDDDNAGYYDPAHLTGVDDEDALVKQGRCPYQTGVGGRGNGPIAHCGSTRSPNEADHPFCRPHAASIRHDRGRGGYVARGGDVDEHRPLETEGPIAPVIPIRNTNQEEPMASAETTSLARSKDFATSLQASNEGMIPQLELSKAYMAARNVSGRPLALVDELAEIYRTAAAKAGELAAELSKQDRLQEEYRANADAGDKDYLLAE